MTSGRRRPRPSFAGRARPTLPGQVCRLRNSGKSQSPAPEQQIDDEYDQQNTTDTDPAAISPPVIPEPAPEEEDKNENNQDQVHSFLRCGFPEPFWRGSPSSSAGARGSASPSGPTTAGSPLSWPAAGGRSFAAGAMISFTLSHLMRASVPRGGAGLAAAARALLDRESTR